MDGEAAGSRLGHCALRFGGLLLSHRLRGLRHLRIRGLRLLRDQCNGFELGAIGLHAAFPFGLQRAGILGTACGLITLCIECCDLLSQLLGATELLVNVCEFAVFLEAGQRPETLDVTVQPLFMESSLESIAKEGTQ